MPSHSDDEGRAHARLLDDPRGLAAAGETTATVRLSNIIDETVAVLARGFREDDFVPLPPVDDPVREELRRHGYRLVRYDGLRGEIDREGETATADLQVTLTAADRAGDANGETPA